MSSMTGIERMTRQFDHLPVDRVSVWEEFWTFTQKKWEDDGKIPAGISLDDHFGFDMATHWSTTTALHPGRPHKTVAEDDISVTFIDDNGATMRRHKFQASTPEHIGYDITNREDWLERAKPFLSTSGDLSKRINFDGYKQQKDRAAEKNRFFFWAGCNVFEMLHPICGHEYMLMGMGLDPDWILDMCNTYTELHIAMLEELFARHGQPDGIFYYEDMGFKGRPFMSPDMYREMIMPSHKRTCDWAHARGLKVMMHSCGFIEPLLPHMIEAGIDGLQAMEIKAGMDLLRISENFGDKIALQGGLDARCVATNDIDWIKRELETKIPVVKKTNGFMLHTDHSVPESTEYETYKFFLDYGLELGTY